MLYQRTLHESISATGIGLHSGQEVTLSLIPAPANTGIVFERSDMNNARVPMDAFLMHDTVLSSNLVLGDVRVGTVEHLLSAVAAMGIDNLIIRVSSAEMPIMDGSAAPFLYLIYEAKIVEQPAPKRFFKIKKEVKVQDGDKWAKVTPYDGGFLMDFEINFDHKVIAATPQSFSCHLSSKNFAEQVACARTFGFEKDLETMRQHKLALGGSLDNAILVGDDKILNKEGLRYPEEFVRHKMLDAVGDLYIIGGAILGHFSAYKSGHGLNNQLIRAILSDKDSFEIVTNYDKNTAPIAYYPADFPLTGELVA